MPSEYEFQREKLERKAQEMRRYNERVAGALANNPITKRNKKIDELLKKGATGKDIARLDL